MTVAVLYPNTCFLIFCIELIRIRTSSSFGRLTLKALDLFLFFFLLNLIYSLFNFQ